MAEIDLEHVSKRFLDGTAAVVDAHFRIRDGEFFILLGPSGCGKSTLLNLIVGLEEVSEGVIRVDGKSVNDRDAKDRNMAMVFQTYALYPHMTVRGNLAFPLQLARMPRDAIAARVEEAASVLGLSELLDRRPATLSGGQRQRVAMGRAIVRRPCAFLMDEPLSNLDARLRVQMRTEINRIHRHLGTTTIYVTHDQTEAMTLADRLAVLRGGRVQQIGTPREVYADPANLFVAGFIGSPTMNLLPAELAGRRLVLPMSELDLPDPVRARFGRHEGAVIAGIRPEHLQPAARAAGANRRRAVFEATADVVEWLGAELYLHFELEVPSKLRRTLPADIGRDAGSGVLRDALPGDGTPERLRLTARVDPAVRAREGERISLSLDPARLSLFDAESGATLAVHSAGEPG